MPTKVRLVKAMIFPVVVHGCESWTMKKAECRRIDAFELWCWRRLLFCNSFFSPLYNFLFSFLQHVFAVLVAARVFFFSCSMWDLVSWPGIEPRPPALRARSLSPCTNREVLDLQNLFQHEVTPLSPRLACFRFAGTSHPRNYPRWEGWGGLQLKGAGHS